MSVSIAVITKSESDFTKLLTGCKKISAAIISPVDLNEAELLKYDCACILGGCESEPLVLSAKSRMAVDAFAATGKKIFYEYMLSFAQNYCAPPVSTRFLRLAAAEESITGLSYGTVLDDQCNEMLGVYYKCSTAKPLLVYKKGINEHAKASLSEEDTKNQACYGIWLETPTAAVCSFRLCNFIKARFAPVNSWRQVIAGLLKWLSGGEVLRQDLCFDAPYTVNAFKSEEQSVNGAISWFNNSNLLIDEGRGGIWEGFGTEVYPDGRQKLAATVRADCSGEAALAYFMHYLYTQNKKSLEISENLEAFIYDKMQISGGLFDGMLRWTDIAWEVCYQDDVARAIMITLLRTLYGHKSRHIAQCEKALEFLVKTTGPDGLRKARTDNLNMTEKDFKLLKENDGAFPCAHYNAYYLASLLVYGKMFNRNDFIDIGVKGMEAIMSAYPKTVREQSETQELCRLILPLSWLYFATKSDKHRQYLYTAAADLQKMHHDSGAYLEWDSDYSAACSKQEGGECSLLSKNGDPVVDLLYSNNWLPLAFMQAYFVTGDEYFYKLYTDNASFIMKSQIKVESTAVNGAWARGFDVELFEVYGLPNDVGWGPWAVESGWTVAQITAGLCSNILKDKLKEFYK